MEHVFKTIGQGEYAAKPGGVEAPAAWISTPLIPCAPIEDLTGAPVCTFDRLIEARVAQTPDATFLIEEGRRLTYGQTLHAARRFAAFVLRQRGGSEPPPRVALFLSKRSEGLIAWFGAALAGSLFVAIHRVHRGAILADQLARSRATILVTEASALAELPDLTATSVRQLVVMDAVPAAQAGRPFTPWPEAIAGEPATQRPSWRPEDAASLVFTSGSTGRSKATLISHAHLCRGGARICEAFGLRPDDVFHDWAPLSHVGGQLDVAISAIVAGAALAQFSTFSASRFWQQVAQAGSTVVFGFANIAHILLAQPAGPADTHNSLRIALIVGVPPDVLARFEQRFNLRTVDAYGMTEAEPLCMRSPGDEEAGHSLGRPNPDFEVAVVDELGRALPARRVGRIVARPRLRALAMLEYEDDAEASAAAWREGWLQTLDLGWFDEAGCLHFSDREHSAIRRRGENISSFELEAVLRGCPGVQDCAALGVPSPMGEQDVKVVAAVLPGSALTPQALRAYLAQRVGKHMLPRYVELRDAIPYNGVGKLMRTELVAHGERTWDAESAPASSAPP